MFFERVCPKLYLGRKDAPPTDPVNLALNAYAFHWSFPEIVADEVGLFKEKGIEVEWHDVTPPRVTNKTQLYTDLLRKGKTDVYHAGEWACINRVSKGKDAWIVAKSPPGSGTLNSTFSIFVRRDSDIEKPSHLAGRGVAIEDGTGSFYTAMDDLERFMPRTAIKLIQAGEPHRRLLALQRGEVAAASLVGPWPAIGEVVGLKLLLRTKRTNPTNMVTRTDLDRDLLRRFLMATNRAIEIINRSPEKYKDSYFRRVKMILEEMPAEFSLREREIRAVLKVPRWKPWRKYTKTEFLRTSEWMKERGILSAEEDPDSGVAPYPASFYS
ncbi:MAG TPA: PhnD/SsuA/transferrin family substrate-binding protein [Nitrososphaerales archaeon]|nr:PhnD/SsuA/transferrin family substrate-binding protein [Nitrososphaerales archaeon]